MPVPVQNILEKLDEVKVALQDYEQKEATALQKEQDASVARTAADVSKESATAVIAVLVDMLNDVGSAPSSGGTTVPEVEPSFIDEKIEPQAPQQ